MTEYTAILQKLSEEMPLRWKSWTREERYTMLKLYYLITKHEASLNDLVYKYIACDSWEDIFRNYDDQLLQDKARGVKIALNHFDEHVDVNSNSEDEDASEEEDSDEDQ